MSGIKDGYPDFHKMTFSEIEKWIFQSAQKDYDDGGWEYASVRQIEHDRAIEVIKRLKSKPEASGDGGVG